MACPLPPCPTDGKKYQPFFDGERMAWAPVGDEGQVASVGANGHPTYVNPGAVCATVPPPPGPAAVVAQQERRIAELERVLAAAGFAVRPVK